MTCGIVTCQLEFPPLWPWHLRWRSSHRFFLLVCTTCLEQKFCLFYIAGSAYRKDIYSSSFLIVCCRVLIEFTITLMKWTISKLNHISSHDLLWCIIYIRYPTVTLSPHQVDSKYSGTCLIWHTKEPGKCVRLCRMSDYSGFILVNRNTFGP